MKTIFLILTVLATSFSMAQDVSDRNVILPEEPYLQSFRPHQKVRIAFIGGSITEMDGYRPMVCENLKKRYPETDFSFVAAGISSTCSTTGAFRLDRDVLSRGPIDLFFVEFAVNDDQDARHSEERAVRGMEGIVRHFLKANPKAGIVMVLFANENLIERYRQGQEATSIAAHRKVAKHYSIPLIDVAREVRQQIDEKTLTWERYGGVHPAPYGNRLVANMIETLFDKAGSAKERQHVESIVPIDSFSYENGRFVSPDSAAFSGDWTWNVPDWKSIPGNFRQTFSGQKLLCADKPGAELTLEFEGKAIGAFVLAGPDAGVLEYEIDGEKKGKTILFHSFSGGLHYPRTVMFDDELSAGKHTLKLKLLDEIPSGGKGTAARIMQFTAN